VKVFVSHSHQDSAAAKALVDMLLAKLSFVDEDIRCTSVPGHQLPFGKNIADILKKDINESPAILALITADSLLSKWVMFELGAAWALDKVIYPIVGPNINLRDLPGPLSHLPCVEIESSDASSRTSDLLHQLAVDLKLEQKNGGKAQASFDSFLNQYKSGPTTTDISKQSPESQEELLMSLIWKLDAEKYDMYGYSVELLSELSSISIPKCEYILNALTQKKLIDKKGYTGAINGNRYTLKDDGKRFLLDKGLVK
jgi:hypothetical protein